MDGIKYIAGLDASYSKADSLLFGAAVILEYPELKVVEYSLSQMSCEYPYVPGKMFKREGRALQCPGLLHPQAGRLEGSALR